MAVATASNASKLLGRIFERRSDESAANTALTVSTLTGSVRRLLKVTVKYSSSVTKNVTVTLNSGAGSTYDTLLQTIALTSATDGVYVPTGRIVLMDDDVIDVVTEAGGGGITSAVTIKTEVY